MKKIAFLMVAVLSVLSLVSCGEKKSSNKEPVSTVEYRDTYFLNSGWAIFNENTDGKMVAAVKVEAIEPVSLIVKDGSLVKKTATRLYSSGEEKEFNFIQVKYNEKDYWTTVDFVSTENTVLGMITKTCRLFSAADDTKMTKEQYKENSFVVVSFDCGEVTDYVKIIVYDGNQDGKQAWIPADCITTSENEIEGVRTQSRLNQMENLKPEVRAEIEKMIWEL